MVVDDHPYIFDFGPGVGLRLSEAYRMGIAGLAMSGVTRAFLTHMHSDHTLGLSALMLTPWMFGREEPLEVYGTQGTTAMTRSLADAYALDVAKRTFNEPHTERGHEIIGRDIVPGIVYTDDLVEIEAFKVQHGEWDPTFHGPFPAIGFRITTPDRTVVISGDTGAFPDMASTYAGCDVLVHEVYSIPGLESRPLEWQSYHARSHSREPIWVASQLRRISAYSSSLTNSSGMPPRTTSSMKSRRPTTGPSSTDGTSPSSEMTARSRP